MTSGQLVRRARIIEEVIDLIADVGADAVQMRDLAQRSGVALATVYRYFRSKEHLLAAALEDWQKRLTRRILAARGPADKDPLPGILDYLRRAQRAFHRHPEMTALMLQTMASTDPEARAAMDHMNRTNVEVFDRLLEGDLLRKEHDGYLLDRPRRALEGQSGGSRRVLLSPPEPAGITGGAGARD